MFDFYEDLKVVRSKHGLNQLFVVKCVINLINKKTKDLNVLNSVIIKMYIYNFSPCVSCL